MKHLYLIIIFLTIGSTYLSAQVTYGDAPELAWYRTFGGSAADEIIDTEIASDNSVYLCGIYSGELDFFGTPVSTVEGKSELFVAKLSEQGEVNWTRPIVPVESSLGEELIDILVVGTDGSEIIYALSTVKAATESVGFDYIKDTRVQAFSSAGELLWDTIIMIDRDRNLMFNDGLGIVAHDGDIIVSTRDELHRLTRNGEVLWSKELDARIGFSSVSIFKDKIYALVNSVSFLLCYDGDCSLLSEEPPADYFTNFVLAIDPANGELVDSKSYFARGSQLFLLQDTSQLIAFGSFGYKDILFDSDTIALVEDGNVTERQGLIMALDTSLSLKWYLTSQLGEVTFEPQAAALIDGLYYFGGSCMDSVSFADMTLGNTSNFILTVSKEGEPIELTSDEQNITSISSGNGISCIATNTEWDMGIRFLDENQLTHYSNQSSGDGGQSSSGYTSAVDEDGNIYLLGEYSGQIAFDAYLLDGGDGFLAKLAPTGEVLWVNNISTPHGSFSSAGVEIDVEGNCFFYGLFSDSLTLNGETITSSLEKGLCYGVLTPSGDLKYLHRISSDALISYGGIATNENGVSLTFMFEGRLELADQVLESNELDGIILDLDQEGSIISYEHFSSDENLYLNGIASYQDGAQLTIGSFLAPSTHVGNIELDNKGEGAALICKLNHQGEPVWAKSMSGQGLHVIGVSLTMDSDENTYLCGVVLNLETYDDTTEYLELSFGDSSLGRIVPQGVHLFVLKLDAHDEMTWFKLIQVDWTHTTFGSSLTSISFPSHKVSTDFEDNLYLAGFYTGGMWINDSTRIQSGDDGVNNFMMKLSEEGDVDWFYSVPNISTKNSGSFQSIDFIADDRILVSGRFEKGSVQIDSTNNLELQTTSTFVAMLQLPEPIRKLVNSVEVAEPETINVYPNPTADIVHWEIDKTGFAQLFDASGRLILHTPFFDGPSSVDVTHLVPGIYYLSIKGSDGSHIVKKIVKK